MSPHPPVLPFGLAVGTPWSPPCAPVGGRSPGGSGLPAYQIVDWPDETDPPPRVVGVHRGAEEEGSVALRTFERTTGRLFRRPVGSPDESCLPIEADAYTGVGPGEVGRDAVRVETRRAGSDRLQLRLLHVDSTAIVDGLYTHHGLRCGAAAVDGRLHCVVPLRSDEVFLVFADPDCAQPVLVQSIRGLLFPSSLESELFGLIRPGARNSALGALDVDAFQWTAPLTEPRTYSRGPTGACLDGPFVAEPDRGALVDPLSTPVRDRALELLTP